MAAVPSAAPEQLVQRLFSEYQAPIQRYCRGQLPSHEEAEDAVQSTFLRVYTALQKGVVPEHEAAWLYKIAHNVCLSRRLAATRRARVETPRDLDTIEESLGAPSRSHDELIGLDDALANMPEKLRTPFLMREWQGLSYQEIADELGVSHSAVETLIFRARRHLAQALETRGGRLARVRGIFDLGGVLGALKALFGGAAAIKAVAAVVAVGIAGVAAGTAIEARDGQSPAAALFDSALAAAPALERLTAQAAAPRQPGSRAAATSQGGSPASAPATWLAPAPAAAPPPAPSAGDSPVAASERPASTAPASTPPVAGAAAEPGAPAATPLISPAAPADTAAPAAPLPPVATTGVEQPAAPVVPVAAEAPSVPSAPAVPAVPSAPAVPTVESPVQLAVPQLPAAPALP